MVPFIALAYTHCSTDYCKQAPQTPAQNPTESTHEANPHTDDPTMRPSEEVPIAAIATQQSRFWEDAVSDDNLDAVRCIEARYPDSVEPEMI